MSKALAEVFMDLSRCPDCKRRLMAMTDRTGRTKMVCLKSDEDRCGEMGSERSCDFGGQEPFRRLGYPVFTEFS